MTSYSKGAWGLFVLSREIGILTDTAISPSTWSRQCPSRYAIRAGCPLTSPLNLPAPGRRQCVYGALRGFARTCVFAKQSLEPILCGLFERPEQVWLPKKASLLPKLRDHYAEFLDHVSLVHLRLLALPTCVGLRYGRHASSAQSFSCVSTPQDSRWPEGRHSHSRLGASCEADLRG